MIRSPEMRFLRPTLAVACGLLMLAGCYKQQSGPAQKRAVAALPAAPLPVNCSTSPPDRKVIGPAIKAAMVQIYGVDQATTDYDLSAVQLVDCQHLAITYHARQRKAASQKGSVFYSNDKWNLPLYGKLYPVN